MNHTSKWMAVICLSFLGNFLSAQDDAREVTDTYVIKNAMVVQKPGTLLPLTDLLVRNGLIETIGKNIAVPFDAQVIQADSMYVYAGFIDAASHTGIPKKQESRERPNGVIPGNPPNDLAGITPELKAADLIDETEKSIDEMRDNGFTVSHIFPDGRMLPGQGVIIVNKDGAKEELVLKETAGMFSQLSGAPRLYPATVIGVMAKWRDLFHNAQIQSAHAEKYALNPAGMKRPVMDEATEALTRVVERTQPVFFKAEKALDVHRVMTLQRDLGFDLVFTDVEQSWPVVDLLKEAKVPVLLSTDLPKEIKKKDEKKDKGDEESDVDPETMALEKKKEEAVARYEGQAGELEKNGISFGFSFIDSKVKDFKSNVLRMIKGGLSEEAALAAMTTIPASIIGLDKVAGTVEQGKMANLVVTDKPYFDEKSNIRYVFADGQLHKYEVKEKKKPENGEEGRPVNVTGDWAYEIEIPGQVQTGVIVVTRNGDGLNIKFASSESPEDFTEGKNVTLEGKMLTFNATIDNGGFSMDISFDLEVDGSSFEGNVTAGNFGSFPITGEKTSTPE